MPGSNNFGLDYIADWFRENKSSISRVLDLGPGRGKYSKVVRKMCDANTILEGIEVWEPYVEAYDLNKKYNRLIIEDARLVDYESLGKYDVIVAGDILEHMSKEEAVSLVDTLIKYSNTLIVTIPTVYFPQKMAYGNPYEEHIKDDWSHTEFLDTFGKYVFDFLYDSDAVVSVYFLRGL